MATNLDIDTVLLREAQQIGGYRTKKETVNNALSEFVKRRKQLEILDLFGRLDPDPDYDYKAARKAR